MVGVSKSSAAGLTQERLKVRDVRRVMWRASLRALNFSIQMLTDALQLCVYLHAA